METSTLLTIIGIIATLVFGFLSIALIKRKKYPGKITLVKQSTLGLFNNIAKNFEEISIQYKSEPIKENVIYLKASILNDGDIDIDGKTVEKTIKINLKPNLKWIKSKVTAKSKELECTSEISAEGNDLAFNFGLIRKKEFFQFEALIETSDPKISADEIYDFISISHRIANTQKVSYTSLLSEEQIDRKKKKIKAFALTLCIQLILLCIVVVIQTLYIKDAPIHYKTPNGLTYSAKAKSDEKIALKNTKTKEKQNITISDLQNTTKFIPFIPQQSLWEKIEPAKYMFPLIVLMFLIMISDEYFELRRSYKLYNIFDNKENYDQN